MRAALVAASARTRPLCIAGSTAGADCTVTLDPDEGIQLAGHQPFDLVFLDMHMPGKSGWDVAREIRASGQSREAFIVLLTGGTIDDFEAATGRSLIDDYLMKPAAMQDIVAILRAVERKRFGRARTL